MEQRTVTILVSVITTLVIVLFAIVLVTKGNLLPSTDKGDDIAASSERVTREIKGCEKFYGNLFMKDAFSKETKKTFVGTFTSNDPNLYLKTKLMCGALIQIRKNYNRNLNQTIEEINKNYGVYGVKLDYKEINGLMRDSSKEGAPYKSELEWLPSVIDLLGKKINEVNPI